MGIVVTPHAQGMVRITTGAGLQIMIGTTVQRASGILDMDWDVLGPVLRECTATTGVTEPLEDGTTAQTDVNCIYLLIYMLYIL